MTNLPNRNRRAGYRKAAALWLLFAGASLVAMEHPADAATTATTATIAVDNTPPAIVFAFEPTVMVHIDGKPVLRDMKSAGVRRVVNTRALLVRAGNLYYLRAGGRWLTATALNARWTLARDVPANLTWALNEATSYKLADPMDKTADDVAALLRAGRAPVIVVRSDAAELIAISGEPHFAPIAGTTLAYVANTHADVFVTANTNWYVLLSGRWFVAPSTTGPWTYVAPDKLPADFARIPADSPKGVVLVSVAGTPQAKAAIASNSIPQTATVNRKQASFTATYDGTPEFRVVTGTSLSYARNAAVPVIRVDASHYYAVSNGVWFAASSPHGPWVVATSVAPAIYTIPVSSPLHYVTYVRVYGVSGDSVLVGYTPGYYGIVSTGTVLVYGTGYRCTAWVGSVWYGCPATYAPAAYWYGGAYPVAGAWNVYGQWGNAVVSGTAAAWANPWTGNYGRAVEGGYYNQATGGRGVGQAAVNTNAYTGTTTAAARGVRYNPETGRVVANEGVAAYNPYTGQAGAANHREVYNSNTGRQTSMAGAAGTGPEGAGAVGGFSTTGSGGNAAGVGGVTYDRDSGTVNAGGAVKVGDDVYAGKNGDVYQKTDGGWEQVERSTAQRQNGQRPSGTATGPVDREQVAHDRGTGSNAASTSRQRRERGSIGNGGFTGAKSGSRPAIGSGGHPAKGVRPRKR